MNHIREPGLYEGHKLHGTPGNNASVSGRETLDNHCAKPRWPTDAELAEWTRITATGTPLWYLAAEKLLALVALLVSIPVIAVTALLIKLTSPGSALFCQQRMSIHARPFKFCKLRTMYADAAERFPAYSDYNFENRELHSIRLQFADDPRVTPLGAFLRRTSLDELPNFWHVLTGDMALVGPRPEMLEMLPYYHGVMLKKFAVRPGITGYAQVYGRGNLNFLQTVELDLQYVEDRSVKTDLRILCLTVKQMIVGDGAF